MTDREKILTMVKEVKETSDVNEIAQLLSEGNWIAIYANTNQNPFQIVLGRI